MYRWLDHTGELELEIEAPDERSVFEAAVAAVGELTGDPDRDGGAHAGEDASSDASPPAQLRDVDVVASDRATLLAGWIEELLFLAETEDLVPVRLARLELGAERLSATVEARLGRPRHLVKAVTYHGLTFEPAGAGCRARVVLDV